MPDAPPSAPPGAPPSAPSGASPSAPPDTDHAAEEDSGSERPALAPRRPHRAGPHAGDTIPKEDAHELLVSLALLSEATKAQLRDIHFPRKSLKSMQRALAPLLSADPPLVEERRRYAFNPGAGTPSPQVSAYRLTEAGHSAVRHDPRYPVKTGPDQYAARLSDPTNSQTLEHDLLGTAGIVALVGHARQQGLSGLFLRREIQLDPEQRAPRIDALLVFHMGGPVGAGIQSWTKDLPGGDELRRVIAFEIDRSTEAISVIRGKARSYRRAEAKLSVHEHWTTHYGRMPLILWLAPDEKRLATIGQAWADEWPEGTWLLATAERLRDNRCVAYHERALHEVRLFAQEHALVSIVQSWPLPQVQRWEALSPPAVALPAPAQPEALDPLSVVPERPEAPAAQVSAAEEDEQWLAAMLPPEPRVVAVRLEDPWPLPGVPVNSVAVRVTLEASPGLVWEGRLWHPTAAPPRLHLGLFPAHEALRIDIPDLDVQGILPAGAHSFTLRATWPVVRPQATSVIVTESHAGAEQTKEVKPLTWTRLWDRLVQWWAR